MGRRLDKYELKYFSNLLYETPWKWHYEYGGGARHDTREIIQSCKRICCAKKSRENVLQDYGAPTLKCYQVSYLYHYKHIPDNDICHTCANPVNKKETLCMEPTHMITANHSENMKRKICHGLIRKYWNAELRFNRLTPDGPLFVNQVPIKYEWERRSHQRGFIMPSPQERYRRRNEKCVCNHHPNCFINFGQC